MPAPAAETIERRVPPGQPSGRADQNGRAGVPVPDKELFARVGLLRDNVAQVFLGQPAAVDLLVIGLLAGGHVLIEDVPGVGKTTLAKALARSIDGRFNRVQLTPDLLPADLLGVSVFNSATGDFEFKPGPIFANVVLADEVNRTTPRTQSALLEAMAEAQVSVENTTHKLERPFMVIATQNPFEFEGTYVLPENQLDRFLLKVAVGYPPRAAERRILQQRPGEAGLDDLRPVLTTVEVAELQRAVPRVRVAAELTEYLLDLVAATRVEPRLHLGVSPRGALALLSAAQARAVVEGRDYAVPDDVKRLFVPVCGHRVVPQSHLRDTGGGGGEAGGQDAASAVLRAILEATAAPA